ncbi:PAS domain S-box protein [Mesorhizobium sp. 1B3]|uniref:sensor histidine kinase n=1 Tax=Mesorhizobium sp. 1B3 TaxID=3243599 RepID=UPI003D959DB2
MSDASIEIAKAGAFDRRTTQAAIDQPEWLFDLLPAAAYVCDANGLIIRYNRRAAELWGQWPQLGDPTQRFCGSFRLYFPDGTPLPHDECPMAVALRTGISPDGQEVVIERPDGSRVLALANIDALKDDLGQIIGAISCLQSKGPANGHGTLSCSEDIILDGKKPLDAGQAVDLLAWVSATAELRQTQDWLRAVIDDLPAAVYTTDAEGRITLFNKACVEFSGRVPQLGTDIWCVTWRLYWPDGTPLPHDECPMAIALKERRPVRGVEAVAERPDGSRVPFMPYPTPIFDKSGKLIGAVNMLVDLTEVKHSQELDARLAAIVESSQDAIISKGLDGKIISVNRAAEQLFGYTAAELVGMPVTILFPEDRLEEEVSIIERIRRGIRVESYETVRRRKDGSLFDVSLTVSPIRDAGGRVIGASKIARDITERKRAQEQRELLLREMNHRVKNLFTLASGIVSLSARSQASQDDMVRALQGRLMALARAHELTLPDLAHGAVGTNTGTSLEELLSAIIAPFQSSQSEKARIAIGGPSVHIGKQAMTGMALLLHELATNSAKYGALSTPTGSISVRWSVDGEKVELHWLEDGGPKIDGEPEREGFGSRIARGTTIQLDADLSREWLPDGLIVHFSASLEKLSL